MQDEAIVKHAIWHLAGWIGKRAPLRGRSIGWTSVGLVLSRGDLSAIAAKLRAWRQWRFLLLVESARRLAATGDPRKQGEMIGMLRSLGPWQKPFLVIAPQIGTKLQMVHGIAAVRRPSGGGTLWQPLICLA
jgi:hypothetical protein